MPTRAEFESRLRTDGFLEIEAKTMAERRATDAHSHDCDVRGFVLSGSFTVTQNGNEQTYRAGEMFAVAAGVKHTEAVGPDGASIIVGRRYEKGN